MDDTCVCRPKRPFSSSEDGKMWLCRLNRRPQPLLPLGVVNFRMNSWGFSSRPPSRIELWSQFRSRSAESVWNFIFGNFPAEQESEDVARQVGMPAEWTARKAARTASTHLKIHDLQGPVCTTVGIFYSRSAQDALYFVCFFRLRNRQRTLTSYVVINHKKCTIFLTFQTK